MKISIGTRSILFGVHQFLFHPLTVVLAWRSLYERWPHWWELVAIICHDLGYWGKPNLDGPEGRRHPEPGAQLTTAVVFHLGYHLRRLKGYPYDAACFFAVEQAFEAGALALGHSREYCRDHHVPPSALCWADKFCIVFDPAPLYLLRAWLSGEIMEFAENARPFLGKVSPWVWHRWYLNRVVQMLELRCRHDYRDQIFRS